MSEILYASISPLLLLLQARNSPLRVFSITFLTINGVFWLRITSPSSILDRYRLDDKRISTTEDKL
jgi:hypothetical protein